MAKSIDLGKQTEINIDILTHAYTHTHTHTSLSVIQQFSPFR